MIHVKDLTKKYKTSKENAVDSISFDVPEGEFFSFLGPNGAGKTTTISVLTTTISKTSGDVVINGFDVEKQAADVRRSIGVLFQNPSLDLNLTAEENIRFHCVLYGVYDFQPLYSMMSPEYKKMVNELADVLEIKKDIFKPLKTFSGGMKRKLEIIRSLTHNPKVLFLDEPTEGLDPVSRKAFWDYLQEIRRKNKTTIFLTTHYLMEAEPADHICIIKKGKIAIEGSPKELKKKLVQEYLVLDAENREALEIEMKNLGLPFVKERRYRVNIPSSDVQHVISSIKTKLTYFDMHNPSLEDAYIEVITN